MKQVKNWLLGGLLAVMLTATALAADLQKGIDAYNANDYITAFPILTPFAEAGNAEAQQALGWMYANGKGVAQNDAEAVKWWRLAAEAGHASAQNNLGLMYKNGWGVAQDDVEAVKWYRRAAEAGNGVAQYSLGWMYANGKGVAQNDAEAVKWWRLAAEAGHAAAQYNLGLMFHNGRGVRQNDAEAVKWWRLAAEAGDAEAQYSLGLMYYNGRGVEQNYGEAIKWYSLAAEQGNASAQNNLDALRKKAVIASVNGDYATAHAVLTALAEAGNVEAQYSLGVMYAEGTGEVLPNYHLGYMWLAIAADQGYGRGTEARRDNVARRMSPAQVGEAQAMAQKCLAQKYKNCEQLSP